MSLLGKYPCENATAATNLSFFTASFSILITIVGSVGNSLVVIAVIWNPYKDLRTPFHYFVGNLSLADLVVGVILGPLSTILHISEGLGIRKHPLEEAGRVVFFTCCTTSLFSLTALTLDRYLAILHPAIYRNKLSHARALMVSVLLWVVSTLLSMIYFVVGFDRYRFIFANTAVVVTFTALIFTSQKILKYLRHQRQQWDG